MTLEMILDFLNLDTVGGVATGAQMIIIAVGTKFIFSNRKKQGSLITNVSSIMSATSNMKSDTERIKSVETKEQEIERKLQLTDEKIDLIADMIKDLAVGASINLDKKFEIGEHYDKLKKLHSLGQGFVEDYKDTREEIVDQAKQIKGDTIKKIKGHSQAMKRIMEHSEDSTNDDNQA